MASAKQRWPLEAGARAPEFELRALNGERKSLRAMLSGGPALLAFFKVSCPVCQFTFPFLERIQQRKSNGTAGLYGVSQDDHYATREFLNQLEISFPALLDSEESGYPVSNAYGISHVPTMFYIEQDGTISWALDGFSRKEIESIGRKLGAGPFLPGENVPEWKSG